MPPSPDRYTHGHHESVLRSHTWRTAQNSARFLLRNLNAGDDLLDVGCGPGTISADLATLVAPGSVTGLDRCVDVISAASASYGNVANLGFVVGDVYDLAFDDARFDVVFAHQVLQHLSDPVAALREMRRVLRKDGLLAIRDADYSTFTWSPADVRLDRWLALYHDVTIRNHADADAGGHLATYVRDAGFSSLDESTSTWTFSEPDERAWWGGLWADRVRYSDFAVQAVAYGLSDHDELATFAEAFTEWAAQPDGVFEVVHGEILARR